MAVADNKYRAFSKSLQRINLIHKEIAAGTYPDVKRLMTVTDSSCRTVKRDLAVIRDELNAPLGYDRRRKGFHYSEIGWSLPFDILKERDFLALFVAEHALKFTGHLPEAEDLKKALAKLVSYFPEKVSIDSAILSDNVSFQSPAFETSNAELRQKLAVAACEQVTVEFDYYSPHNRQTENRRADIYHLHNYGGDWYAVSFDHKRRALRDFHVGRISNLKITQNGFEIRKRIWNKDKYLREHFNMTRGGKMTQVEIWFDPYQAQWIRLRKNFHADEIKEDLEDGSLRLKFKIGEKALEAVARFCLQYAGHCIVEKPEKLREIVKVKLSKAGELNR